MFSVMPLLGGVRLGLLVWAFVGPVLAGGVVYSAMLLREAVLVQGAVANARNGATITCNQRVAEIQRVHDQEVDDSVDSAIEAVDALSPTPVELAARQALCDQSPGCKSRRTQ
jgi:hypothetical protein